MSAENKAKTDSNASTSKASDNRPSANKTSDTTPTKTTRTQCNESIYIETEFLPSTQSTSQVESIEHNVGNIPNYDYNFEVSFHNLTNQHQKTTDWSFQLIKLINNNVASVFVWVDYNQHVEIDALKF